MRPTLVGIGRRCAALAVAATTAACSTFTQGPMQRINISSEPAGARVTLRHCGPRSSGVTPIMLLISRRAKQCEAGITLDGYETTTLRFHRVLNQANYNIVDLGGAVCSELECSGGWEIVAVAVASTAFVGSAMLVDFATGAKFRQIPSRIAVGLCETGEIPQGAKSVIDFRKEPEKAAPERSQRLP